MVWPSAAIRRNRSGCADAGLPSTKNVARTHSAASAARIFGVVGGHGPSSKVSTTSWSLSGSVCGKLFRPTRGKETASTARIREVPSVSWRGHSAARASAVGVSEIASASAAARVLERVTMRDEDGKIRHEFVEAIARAITARDTAFLRAAVAELHEADLGDLIGALEAE